MTNAPLMFFCRTTDGNDLVPMLVVVLVFLAGYLLWTRLPKGSQIMKIARNAIIVVALIAAVTVIVAIKRNRTSPIAPAAPATATQAQALPRLVDLGADKCIPCRMMAPILDEMKKTCAGQLQVDFIDVWMNPGAGEQFGVRVIPTQVFFSADGKELYRHEGFLSKEDILAKWKELGVSLTPNKEAAP